MWNKRYIITSIIISLGGIIIIPVIVLISLSNARECVKKASCVNNLKQIGIACHMYAQDNEGVLPDTLSCIYPTYASNLKVFTCPNTNNKISCAEEIDKNKSYIYVNGLTKDGDPDTLVAYDKPENHKGKDRNELFLDGHVKWKSLENKD